MQKIAVISLFPQLIESYLEWGIIRKALEHSLEVKTYHLRDFGEGVHQCVDDRPFGGGPGMVLRADILLKALQQAQTWLPGAKVVAFSPVGHLISQHLFQQSVTDSQNFIFICGRYEGFDQRFLDHYVDEQWCIGDFILTGGELAALTCIDAMARLHPGVLQDPLSAQKESFSQPLLDYPHYTRPAIFEGHGVPDVLISGNHALIEKWRQEQSYSLTQKYRPDLLKKNQKSW